MSICPTTLPETILGLLACPNCRGELDFVGDQARCLSCDTSYPLAPSGWPDLRLRCQKRATLHFEIGPNGCARQVMDRVDAIPVNPHPQIDFRSIPISKALRHGNRLTPALLSHFPRAKPGQIMLDVGCGGQDFRDICAKTGFEYVGIDHDESPMLLADAHALPFKDGSFDFAVSFAVMEHLRNPHVAMRELMRVIKPGSLFIGSVGFVEPYHLNSYYPMSPLGTWDTLSSSGFDVLYVEPNAGMGGLQALAEMSLFPHAPQILADLLVLPIDLLHRLWWKLGYLVERRPAASERTRRMNNAGGFRFICRKPAHASMPQK